MSFETYLDNIDVNHKNWKWISFGTCSVKKFSFDEDRYPHINTYFGKDINFPSCFLGFCKINIGAVPTSADKISELRSNLFYEYATLGEHFTETFMKNGFFALKRGWHYIKPPHPLHTNIYYNIFELKVIFTHGSFHIAVSNIQIR